MSNDSLQMTAADVAAELRVCAKGFRVDADPKRFLPMKHCRRLEVAGQIVCHAADSGYFPSIPAVLELVDWSRGPTEPRGGKQAVLVRGPAALVLRLSGADSLPVYNRGGKLEIVGPLDGGPLKRKAPASFNDEDVSEYTRADGMERLATLCEWLADQVERHMTAPGESKPAKAKRGRLVEHPPKHDEKLIQDWRNSGLTKAQFEEIRGLPSDAVYNAQNREKSRAHRRR